MDVRMVRKNTAKLSPGGRRLWVPVLFASLPVNQIHAPVLTQAVAVWPGGSCMTPLRLIFEKTAATVTNCLTRIRNSFREEGNVCYRVA